MKLSFHGADRGVTGSCHLVECAGKRVLIDCGLFQGGRELDEENAGPFGFDPKAIDYLLLTHAHLDHCGRIPLLVKRGFTGEIVTTAATRELARLVMLNSAHLQEEEARHRARRAGHSNARSGDVAALYATLDAMNSLEYFGRTAVYGREIAIAPGIAAIFVDAGHILGSASILLRLTEDGRTRTVLFSGDLGNRGRPLLRDPVVPKGADAVVMETTYGDREHRSFQASTDELIAAIADATGRGGNVIVPTFALERAQELLYFLHQGVAAKALPANLQVFLDSPMAISATEIFGRHPEGYEPEIAALFREGRDPFGLDGLHFVREAAEFDRAQHHPVWRAHHGGLGHVHRRAGAPPSAPQPQPAGMQRGVRRLRGRGDARAHHHRRRENGEAVRRRDPGARAHPHHQRVFGARRPQRTPRVARQNRRAGDNLPGARRSRRDAPFRGRAQGHAGGDAGDGPVVRAVTPPSAPLSDSATSSTARATAGLTPVPVSKRSPSMA